jgi:hypothetical protein
VGLSLLVLPSIASSATINGFQGHTVEAIPIGRLKEIFAARKR